jgi:hypothetical protein
VVFVASSPAVCARCATPTSSVGSRVWRLLEHSGSRSSAGTAPRAPRATRRHRASSRPASARGCRGVQFDLVVRRQVERPRHRVVVHRRNNGLMSSSKLTLGQRRAQEPPPRTCTHGPFALKVEEQVPEQGSAVPQVFSIAARRALQMCRFGAPHRVWWLSLCADVRCGPRALTQGAGCRRRLRCARLAHLDVMNQQGVAPDVG